MGSFIENQKFSSSLNALERHAKRVKLFQLKDKLDSYVVECMDIFKKHYSDANDIKKVLKKARSNIKNKQIINKEEIILLFATDLDSNELLELEKMIDEYNSLVESKSKIEIITKEKNEEKEEKKYVDFTLDETPIIEDEKDDILEIARKYLKTVESLKDILSIKIFIDSISYSSDFAKIISHMISIAKENNLKEEVISLLNQYKVKTDERKIEKVDIIRKLKEESSKSKRRIYFHGFLDDTTPNLLEVTQEYYKDVNGAYMQLKNSIDTGVKPLEYVKNVLEKRYKDIRVYFYRLPNNIIIILGIERKDQNVSDYIRRVIVKREKTPFITSDNKVTTKKIYDEFEKLLKKQKDVDEFLKEYDEKASLIEKEFLKIISEKIK